jgi:hypothetical protein
MVRPRAHRRWTALEPRPPPLRCIPPRGRREPASRDDFVAIQNSGRNASLTASCITDFDADWTSSGLRTAELVIDNLPKPFLTAMVMRLDGTIGLVFTELWAMHSQHQRSSRHHPHRHPDEGWDHCGGRYRRSSFSGRPTAGPVSRYGKKLLSVTGNQPCEVILLHNAACKKG